MAINIRKKFVDDRKHLHPRMKDVRRSATLFWNATSHVATFKFNTPLKVGDPVCAKRNVNTLVGWHEALSIFVQLQYITGKKRTNCNCALMSSLLLKKLKMFFKKNQNVDFNVIRFPAHIGERLVKNDTAQDNQIHNGPIHIGFS